MPRKNLLTIGIVFLSVLTGLKANAQENAADKKPIAQLGTSMYWHGGKIDALTFSTDGKVLVMVRSGARSGNPASITLWRQATGERICKIIAPEHEIGCLTFSPDRRTLAIGCGAFVVLWNADTGAEIRRYALHKQTVSFVQFSPDGKTIFSADRSATVHRWDVATARRLDEWRPWKGAQPHLKSGLPAEDCEVCRVSPDGKTIVWQVCSYKPVGEGGGAIGDRYFLRIRDLRAGGGVREIDCRPGAFGSMVFAPDGRHLASGLAGVWLWDLKSGRPPRELGRGFANVKRLFFFGDSTTLASLHDDNVLLFWDLTSGRRVGEIDCPKREGGKINPPIALSADGATLAIGGPSSLILWDVKAMQEVCPGAGIREPIRKVEFAPDGHTLSTIGDTAQCRWDTKTWKQIDHSGRWRFVAEETTLTVAGLRFLTQARDETVRLRETTTGEELRRCEMGSLELQSGVIAPDGNSAVLMDGKQPTGAGLIVDLSNGKERARLKFLRLAAAPIYSPDGKRLAWVGEDQCVHLLDAATGKEARQFAPESPGQMRGDNYQRLAFSHQGDYLACRYSQRSDVIRVWETHSGVEIGRIIGANGAKTITTFALSSDGRTVATGQEGDDAVRLWETASGQVYRCLNEHRDTVLALTYSAADSYLVSGSRDHTALVWDMRHPQSATRKTYTKQELSSLWENLREKPRLALDVVWVLGNAPDQSVPLLKEHLHPVEAITKQRIQQLLLELDDDAFAVRETASKRLGELGELVEADLRKTRMQSPSPEVRRRIDKLLAALQRNAEERTKERLRQVRAVTVLEHAATPEARSLLTALSRGDDNSPLTREARAALRRLDKHP
jgi:WD40 repeat protein